MKVPAENTLAERLLRCAPQAARELVELWRMHPREAGEVLDAMVTWVRQERFRGTQSATVADSAVDGPDGNRNGHV